jgi:putative sigma-54 modulation protein
MNLAGQSCISHVPDGEIITMQIVTNGRNIELTEAIKDYVKQKISRLESHFDFIQEVHVILEVEKNPRIAENQLAEATIHVPGAVIRVEAASENLYASIDKLADKIERSLRKHKTKLLNRTKNSHDTIRKEGGAEEEELIEEFEDEDFELEVTVTSEA